MHKKMSERLAELERLEATVEQERQAMRDAGYPDLDTLDDLHILWEVVLALRCGDLHPALSAPLGPVGLVTISYRAERFTRFYTTLVARAQPLLDALPRPFVPLGPWEVHDAIRAIDAGQAIVTWGEYLRGGATVRHHYRLSPAAQEGQPADEDLLDTLNTVNFAVDLVNRQVHYPQPRAVGQPELETVDEWRAWLGALLEEHDAQALDEQA